MKTQEELQAEIEKLQAELNQLSPSLLKINEEKAEIVATSQLWYGPKRQARNKYRGVDPVPVYIVRVDE